VKGENMLPLLLAIQPGWIYGGVAAVIVIGVVIYYFGFYRKNR
jgi:hypothetical protein